MDRFGIWHLTYKELNQLKEDETMHELIQYIPTNELKPFALNQLNTIAVPQDIRRYRLQHIVQLVETDFPFALQEIKRQISHQNYHYGLIQACRSVNTSSIPPPSQYQLIDQTERTFYLQLSNAFIKAYGEWYQTRHYHEIESYLLEVSEIHRHVDALEGENQALNVRLQEQTQLNQHLQQQTSELIQAITQAKSEIELNNASQSQQDSLERQEANQQEERERERQFELRKHEIDTEAQSRLSQQAHELEKVKLQRQTAELRLKREREINQNLSETLNNFKDVLKY